MSAKRRPRKPSPFAEADRTLAVQVAYVVAGVLRFDMPIAPNDFFRRTRGDAKEALARQIVAYILTKHFDMPMQRAGDAMNRHRTTLTNSKDVIFDIAVGDDTDGFGEFLERLGKLAREMVDLGKIFAECERAVTPDDELAAA